MTDKDIIDLLGLTDREIKVGVSLEDDLQYTIENGIDKYIKELKQQQQEKQDFIDMFRECFDEIVKIIERDPKQQIAVNCKGCRYGGRLDLSSQYAKPTRKK